MPDDVVYCACGCAEATTVYKGRARRFIHGHNRRTRWRWHEEDRGYDTPCWIWEGVLDRAGYARCGHTSGPGGGYAYRQTYVMAYGSIPEGLDLDHLCSVRPCVRPDHLEPVTRVENARRAQARRRHRRQADLTV